jgi:hypothetical protein
MLKTDIAKNDKESLRALIRGVTQPLMILLQSDANYGTEFSNIQMLTNKITGETRLIVINHDDNQALILEQMQQYSWKVLNKQGLE